MAITKMTGRTYEMLLKDKRVATIHLIEDKQKVNVALAEGWGVPHPNSDRNWRTTRLNFDNWCDARNWVRKAVMYETADA